MSITSHRSRFASRAGRRNRRSGNFSARLAKNYGTLQAVRGISLEVARGEIFGLIGADGAGKTTTFQILAGVMKATGGSAEIFGKAAQERAFADRLPDPNFQPVPRFERDGKHPLHR